MTVTAIEDGEFGCLWCGSDLKEDDQPFCNMICREAWFRDDLG